MGGTHFLQTGYLLLNRNAPLKCFIYYGNNSETKQKQIKRMNLTKIIRLNKTIHTMGNHKSPQKGSETTGIFLELISEILNENVFW